LGDSVEAAEGAADAPWGLEALDQWLSGKCKKPFAAESAEAATAVPPPFLSGATGSRRGHPRKRAHPFERQNLARCLVRLGIFENALGNEPRVFANFLLDPAGDLRIVL
jgi:hypothetical protein